MCTTGVWQQGRQQVGGPAPVVGVGALDEGERPAQGRPVTGEDPVDQFVDGGAHEICSSNSVAAAAMTVPGGKMAAAPAARRASWS